MNQKNASDLPATDRGVQVALMFALAAQRLSAFYDQGQWLTDARCAQLAGEWLARTRRNLPLERRRHLSALSDQLARHIADSLSREAGLYTAHEMMEALDPNYHSEIGRSLMAECERLLDFDSCTGTSDEVRDRIAE